ncbi:MAG: branched-chain amino acid ABC transporter permease [Chloroflexota bacterium]|nr:MAG: branched-chain amino acid ABC transporter permease [Chloroflexota bacterium]
MLTDYEQDLDLIRTRGQLAIILLFLALMCSLPFVLSVGWLTWVNVTMVTIIAVIGIQILSGYAGLMFIGQSALMGVSAYVTATLTTNFHYPFWVALPVAIVCSVIMGLLAGVPALRVKGFYLAITSIALQFIFVFMITHAPASIFGQSAGLRVTAPTVGNIVFNNERSLFYLIFVFAVIAILVSKNLMRSRVGRAFIAIRDNPVAARSTGVNLFRYKLLAFLVCSLFAGLAGSLWAIEVRWVASEQFTLFTSIWYLGIIIIGGRGTLLGAVLGTIALRLIEEIVNQSGPSLLASIPGFVGVFALLNVIGGLVIALFLILQPKGIVHAWSMMRNWVALWPFNYKLFDGR